MSAEALPIEASEPPPEEEQSFRGTVALETHGCKLNQADSETLRGAFKRLATAWCLHLSTPTSMWSTPAQ